MRDAAVRDFWGPARFWNAVLDIDARTPEERLRAAVRVLAGPALTFVALTAVEQTGASFAPGAILLLLLGVAYASAYGGLVSGLLSAAVISWKYAFLLFPARAPISGGGDLRFLFTLAVLAPVVALLRTSIRGLLGRWAPAAGDSPALVPESAETRAIRYDAFLAEASALIDMSLGFEAMLERTSSLAVPELADWCAIYLDHEGELRRVHVGHPELESAEALEHALRNLPLTLNRHHPLERVRDVARSGASELIRSISWAAFETAGRTPAERNLLHGLTPRQLLLVPLVSRGRITGAMAFAAAMPEREYAIAERRLAEEFCRRVALAIENTSLFQSALASRAEAESARQQMVGILEGFSTAFFALDRDGRFTYVNGEGEKLIGRARSDILGREIWSVLPERPPASPLYRAFRKAAETGAVTSTEFRSSWTDARRWLEVHLAPTPEGMAVHCRDITERREMEEALRQSEEQLQHSQKMEAIGRLAGGVAHDFNNMLMSISGYTELLLLRAGPESELREDLEEIRRATDRAIGLTRQLLSYSRKQVRQPQRINLNSIVTDLQRSLLRLLGDDVALTVRSDGNGAWIHADPGQVEQVILNLAVNARDAMPEGGTLTLSIDSARLDGSRSSASLLDAVAAGDYVELRVSDSGAGIDPQVLPHIFEPFFTTKEQGKGTGLGLATVYGIVRQNGGTIAVGSVRGEGTTFRVYFPVCAQEEAGMLVSPRPRPSEAADADERYARPAPPAAAPGKKKRAAKKTPGAVILVAEDEPSVRKFVCGVLGREGYQVLEARNGLEGVAVSQRHQKIDLLLTDVMMPEMGGRELANRLTMARPELRIVFMSGYAENEIAHQGELDPGCVLLEKPFSAGVLLETLARVLAGAPARAGAS